MTYQRIHTQRMMRSLTGNINAERKLRVEVKQYGKRQPAKPSKIAVAIIRRPKGTHGEADVRKEWKA